jgi:acetyl-CoA synthetase
MPSMSIPVAESAIVGFPHDIKGNALYGYVILKAEKLETRKTCLKKLTNIYQTT